MYFSDLEELGQAYELESSLISVNFSAPMADGCFVVYHFFGHTSHELTARINLEQLMQSQKAALLTILKSLHNFSTVFAGQKLTISTTVRAFCKLSGHRAADHVAEKNGPLVDRVRHRYVEFWARNVAQGRQAAMRKSLFNKLQRGCFFGYFRSLH